MELTWYKSAKLQWVVLRFVDTGVEVSGRLL
jgi:hypothetical protein